MEVYVWLGKAGKATYNKAKERQVQPSTSKHDGRSSEIIFKNYVLALPPELIV